MKRGFTLIELLGVIVVLGLLALIAIPSVTKTIKNQQESLYKSQLEMIKEAAKGYVASNIFSIDTDTITSTDPYKIYLYQLQDGNYIEKDIQNPKTKKLFGECLLIKYQKVENTNAFEYVIDETTVNNNKTDDDENPCE